MKTLLANISWLWKTLALLASSALIGILLNIVTITVLTISLVGQGLPQTAALKQAQAWTQGFAPQVIISAASLLGLMGLFYLLVMRIERRTWADFGLHLTLWPGLAAGALLALPLAGLPLLTGLLTGSLQFLGVGITFFSVGEVVQTLLLAAILALASGFIEEIVFRGYLQARIFEKLGPLAALGLTALLFALAHPAAQTDYPALYLLTAFSVGLVFGLTYFASGSLWTAIGLHIIWNYIQIALVAVRGATDERFFGAPLWALQNIRPLEQLWFEFAVVLAAIVSLVIFKWTKSAK